MSDFVWGLSKFRDFETCPAMFYAKYVTKEWVDTPSAAIERGNWVDRQLEDAVRYDLQLPEELIKLQPFVDACASMKRQGLSVTPQLKMGLAVDFTRVDYFKGSRLRARAMFDLSIENDRHFQLYDYKTGKYKAFHNGDAEFYGAMCHVGLGALSTDVAYLYVDEPQNCFTHKVKDAALVLANWWKKFDYADKQIAAGNIPAVTNHACGWCGNYKCPRNKNPKLEAYINNGGVPT